MGEMQDAMEGMGNRMLSAVNQSSVQLNSLLSDALAEGLSSVQASVAQRLTANEAETGRAHLRLDSHDQRLASLETKVQELNTSNKRMADENTRLAQRLAAQGTQVANIQTAVAAEVEA
eukprot:10530-Karenia_brevis.AAC.1